MRKVAESEFSGKSDGKFREGMAAQIDKPHKWLVEIYHKVYGLDKMRKVLHIDIGYGRALSSHGKYGDAKNHKRGVCRRATGAGRKNYLLPSG